MGRNYFVIKIIFFFKQNKKKMDLSEREIPEKCRKYIDLITKHLEDVSTFLKFMKCPYAKELYDRTLEWEEFLKEMERCKKCNCNGCECLLDEVVKEFINTKNE